MLENEPSTSQSTQMFVTNKSAKPNNRNSNYNQSTNYHRLNNRGYRGRGRCNYNGYPNNRYWQGQENSFRSPNNYNQRGRGVNRGRNAHAYYQQQFFPAGTNQTIHTTPVPQPHVQDQINVHPLGQPFGQRTE